MMKLNPYLYYTNIHTLLNVGTDKEVATTTPITTTVGVEAGSHETSHQHQHQHQGGIVEGSSVHIQYTIEDCSTS
jgi:hypothetical protein